ncbi:zinc ribbon domain-containing protein [Candidatus Bathyarchaeota archaeon]|nr:zinc ribbon domain-containing protein [Candidatus Bathyarchaeota archaeon]
MKRSYKYRILLRPSYILSENNWRIMNLIFCIKCGKELPKDAQFCSVCGINSDV